MAKFFSLFSQTDVLPNPEEKIIPASEFSKLTSSYKLTQKIKEEAEEFRKEIAIEAEKIKELASNEGFQEGLDKLSKHLFALDQELKELRENVHQNILPLALKAAKKIVGEELKLHPDRIVSIVLNSLKPVTQHKKITIYVNSEDLKHLEENRSLIKEAFEHLESLRIQERDDIEPGGCMIETEAGIINAQLENQWRSLEAAFRDKK